MLTCELQIYEKRTTVVKESEKEKWSMLSFQYMTEESDDDEEPNAIVLHKLSWRSESKLCCNAMFTMCIIYSPQQIHRYFGQESRTCSIKV